MNLYLCTTQSPPSGRVQIVAALGAEEAVGEPADLDQLRWTGLRNDST